MANPSNPVDMNERRNLLELLDRLADVQPGRHCMPDVLVDQWFHGDSDRRRKIEEAIGRMPKRKTSN